MPSTQGDLAQALLHGQQQIMDRMNKMEDRLDTFRPTLSATGNVLDFINDRCEHGFHQVIDKSTLYTAYEAWCLEKTERISSRPHFFMKLYRSDKAYSSTRTRKGKRIKVVRGVSLKQAELPSPRQSLLELAEKSVGVLKAEGKI